MADLNNFELIVILVGFVLVCCGVGVIATVVWARNKRRRDEAFDAFAAQHGFVRSKEAGHYSSDLVLRGRLDGVAIEIRETYRHKMSSSVLLTRYRYESPFSWPGRLIAYTPSFRKGVGGPQGKVMDHPSTVAYLGGANDYEIGDPELDEVLAIDCDDLGTARSLLTSPDVKAWVIHAVDRCKHLRIKGREVAIEIRGRETKLEEMTEHARCTINIAMALHQASIALGARQSYPLAS